MFMRKGFESNDKGQHEVLKSSGCLARASRGKEQGHGKGDKERKSKDVGARHSASLAEVKTDLRSTANPALALADI